MKRTWLAFVSVLSISILAGTCLINAAEANPIAPSDIEIYSPQRKTYYSTEIELGFIVPSRYVFPRMNFTSFSYHLDGQANVTVSGNTTLTGLSWGSHTLVVYGEDADGKTGFSQIVRFDVFLSTDLFAVTITAIVFLALVSIGVLVYWEKRKR